MTAPGSRARDLACRGLTAGLMSLLGASGCYLAHERPSAADARADAGRDASTTQCERLEFGPSVLLDGHGGVTPRLVPLDDGAVGVAYVAPGAGDPTLVWYERLDASLARVTGPVLVARDASSWAQPARRADGLGMVIAYSTSPRSEPSLLAGSDLDGHPSPTRVTVALPNPAVLRPSATGLFWLAMEMREQNAFVLAHVGQDGTLVTVPQRIELGRYGSGFGAATRADGGGEVLGYPSEGPRGVRRARARAIEVDGTLGPERTLSMDGADAAIPVFVGDELALVYRTDAEIRIATLDPASLETRAERAVPRVEGTLFAAAIGVRLVIGALGAGWVTALDASTPGASPIRSSTPLAGTSGALDWVELPGTLVLAAGLVSGGDAAPWVVRVDCVQ